MYRVESIEVRRKRKFHCFTNANVSAIYMVINRDHKCIHEKCMYGPWCYACYRS